MPSSGVKMAISLKKQRVLKPRVCRICKKEYTPRNSLQKVCGVECAIKLARQQQEVKIKREIKAAEALKRKERVEARLKIKKPREWLSEAQVAFNAYVRLRDADEPCISCGRYHEGQYHAGHYLSIGAHPELRFEEDNVHKQCSVCNNFKSGNLIGYRDGLIDKIGLERVEWLEGPHEPSRYSIEDLKKIKAKYKRKVRNLNAAKKLVEV